MERNLPVQMVKTRGHKDEFLKEGMGSEPKWATAEVIQRNGKSILTSINEFESYFNFDDERILPLLVSAKLNSNATAKTYRANVRSVFDENEKRNIIGIENQNELLLKIDNRESISKIKSNITKVLDNSAANAKKYGVAAVAGLVKFTPYVEEGLEGSSVKVRLVDYLNYSLNELSQKKFEEYCKNNLIIAEKIDYSPGLRLYEIINVKRNDIDALAQMDSVISIKRMPYVELSLSPEPYNTEMSVKEPINGEDYAVVGLLDSGVADIPHLRKWLKGDNQNVADLSDDNVDFWHGTPVAGIMVYGDELLGKKLTKCSPLRIVSCIVNTSPDNAVISEKELIIYIKDAIKNNPGVKVWNLSQGSNEMISDNCFSDFAIALDYIQKENNVLICKSAGNIDFRNPSNVRLTKGADSIRSLVVGSIAHKATSGCEHDAKVGQRSPFSRIGLGPEYLLKPDLVSYGGNNSIGIESFSMVGYQSSYYRGTSFSTPRITAMAANLFHQLNKEFDSTLIKALLIHSATYPNLDGLNKDDIQKELGHGLPSDISAMLNNDENEFTMIWQPELLSDRDYQIQNIPFPSFMVDENGFLYGDITVTLVSDPILKESEGNEYCQTDIEVLLQTYDGIDYCIPGAAGVSKRYRNSDRLINPNNILATSLYSAKSFKVNDASERTLISKHLKYQPVKKYHVSLENMKASKKELCLVAGKAMCLKIITLYRDATKADALIDGVIDAVKATIIITIKDTRGNNLLYDECMRMLDVHNFEHNNIELRENIEVDYLQNLNG